MTPDGELLRRFAESNSEEAFAELVERHVDLVYSAALRQVNGDTHLAKDVAQTVFADLARKSASLSHRPMLTGWLYTSTHFAAAKAVRCEQRRRSREQEAHTMSEMLHDSAPQIDWDQLRPILDAAMQELKETDREAILLRFFENRQLGDIGIKLGLSENAARMRVDRAVDRLREKLIRQGVTTTAAALASAITANAVQLAPAGLSAALASASVAAVANGGTTLSLLKILGMTKLKATVIGGVIIASAATSLVIQNELQVKLHEQDGRLHQQMEQLAQLQSEHEGLAAAMTQAITPTVDTNELEHLRAQAVPMRQRAEDLAALRQEQQRLKAALDGARKALLPRSDTNAQSTSNSAELDARMIYAMALTRAMHQYASEHDDIFPTNLEQTLNYFRKEERGITNLSPSQFEIMFQGSRKNINQYAHPNSIILIKQKQPFKNIDGKWVVVWASLNGMGSTYCPQDGNFDEWVRDHTAKSDNQQP